MKPITVMLLGLACIAPAHAADYKTTAKQPVEIQGIKLRSAAVYAGRLIRTLPTASKRVPIKGRELLRNLDLNGVPLSITFGVPPRGNHYNIYETAGKAANVTVNSRGFASIRVALPNALVLTANVQLGTRQQQQAFGQEVLTGNARVVDLKVTERVDGRIAAERQFEADGKAVGAERMKKR
jgi:hypothetical protein